MTWCKKARINWFSFFDWSGSFNQNSAAAVWELYR